MIICLFLYVFSMPNSIFFKQVNHLFLRVKHVYYPMRLECEILHVKENRWVKWVMLFNTKSNCHDGIVYSIENDRVKQVRENWFESHDYHLTPVNKTCHHTCETHWRDTCDAFELCVTHEKQFCEGENEDGQIFRIHHTATTQIWNVITVCYG